jgi:hypothetical protein
VLGALSDLLMINEAEVLVGTNGASEDPYPGFMSFALENTVPVFTLAAPYLTTVLHQDAGGQPLGAKIYRSWKKGLERLVLRHVNDYLVSARNQSAHHLVSFMSFALGIQEPDERAFYESMARRWARRFFDSIGPAGYFQENSGPCSSYEGITLNLIGRYVGLTRMTTRGVDTLAEDALMRAYSLFNHSSAVEPDGSALSGFNFNHRVGRGFDRTQHLGATKLTDYLEEVGVWSRDRQSNSATARQTLRAATLGFDQITTNVPVVSFPFVPDRFHYYTAAPGTPNKFPAEETQSFIRRYGDEYIAVKRPGYFAGIYVGRPAPDTFALRHRARYQYPTTAGAYNSGSQVIEDLPPESGASVSIYNANPLTGGGLTIFSTPAYGAAVLSTTWSALAHHGVVAIREGRRFWADYFATSFDLDAVNGTLSVSGRIEALPLEYTRHYNFLNDRLEITLHLRATSSFTAERVIEVIPVPTCTRASCGGHEPRNRKFLGANLELGQMPGVPNGQEILATHVTTRNSTGHGALFELAAPSVLSIQRDGLRYIHDSEELQVGRIELKLPNAWVVGQEHSVSYSLRAITP